MTESKSGGHVLLCKGKDTSYKMWLVFLCRYRSAASTGAVGGSTAPSWSLGQMPVDCGKIRISSSIQVPPRILLSVQLLSFHFVF